MSAIGHGAINLRPSKADAEARSVGEFVSKLSALCAQNLVRPAIYYVHDHFDRWLASGQVSKCADALSVIAVDALPDAVIVALLGATLPVAGAIEGRGEFVERARVRLSELVSQFELTGIISRLG